MVSLSFITAGIAKGQGTKSWGGQLLHFGWLDLGMTAGVGSVKAVSFS